MLLAIGPGLTTVLGQLVALGWMARAYGGSDGKQSLADVERLIQNRRRRLASEPRSWRAPARSRDFNSASVTCCGSPCGSACLLSLIRLSGVPFETVLPLLCWLARLSSGHALMASAACSAWPVVGCERRRAAVPRETTGKRDRSLCVSRGTHKSRDRRQSPQPAKSFHVKRVGQAESSRIRVGCGRLRHCRSARCTYSSGLITNPLSSFG